LLKTPLLLGVAAFLSMLLSASLEKKWTTPLKEGGKVREERAIAVGLSD